MLYRKTTTAFSAVILGVMALLGATAHAQINLNAAGTAASPIGTVTFSRETLPRPGARQTHYEVTVDSSSQNDLNLMSVLGTVLPAGVGADTPRTRDDGLGGLAVRYDLDNLQWAEALSQTTLYITNAAGTPLTDTASTVPRGLRAGGTATAGTNPLCPGRTCAIFEVGNGAAAGSANDLPADTRLILVTWPGVLAVHPDGGGTARVRVYRNFDDALTATTVGLRSDTGVKRAVDVKSSVTTRIMPGTPAVADVAADPRFTNFAPAGVNTLGNIAITLNTAHYKAGGGDTNTKVGALADVMDVPTSGITFTDSTQVLDFATFTLRESCSERAASPVAVAEMGDNVGQGTAGVFSGTRNLCVAPRTTATTAAAAATAPNREIPVTTIMASVEYSGVTGNAFAPAGAMGAVGSIERNGASVQIGYLTVSDRYNQRIIITNRSMSDAEYELTNFYTEDGTEASGGEDVMGVVPAATSIVVLTRDAVQFTGSRARGSATLAVTAPAAMVSVATTQVNLSDGSTDTVNYDVTGAGQ